MKTKNLFRVTGALLLSINTLFITSCDDDDPAPVTPTNTITDQVVNGASFSTLETAVVRCNLAGTLASAGPFTVFAPDNDAFNASGLTAAASTLDTATLKKILLYHTLASRVASSAISGSNGKTTMVSGDSVFITKNAGGVFVNGVKVKAADVSADNGVIHVVDRVIVPPSGNIVQTLVADTSFSLLVAAVTRVTNAGTAGGGADVAGILSGSTIYTLFAPNNAAFRKIGINTVADVNAQTVPNLLGILAVHVIANRGFSCDLSNGQNLDLPLGGTKKIAVTINGSGVFLKVNPTSTAAQVTGPDRMARNGVIHVIDQVLLP